MKVNHHFVPQFYLKNFSDDKKSIGMFLSQRQLYVKKASIRKQAFKKNLYGQNADIENLLMEIEGVAAKCIRNILNSFQLPSKGSSEYELICLFLLLSEARVEKTAESMNNFINQQMKLTMKMDKNFEINDHLIEKANIGLDIPNLPSMQIVAEIYPILFDLSMILIISDCDRRFITSDNPLTRYNQFYVFRNYQLRGYGLGNVGIQLFYPLSPKVCLLMHDSSAYKCDQLNGQILRITKGKQIDELNKLFYLNSFDYIYFCSEIPESYIRRVTNGLTPANNIKKEVNIFGSADSALIHYQQSFVKQKIKLPFMKLNPVMANMPLPAHMAGPVRPYAQRFGEKPKPEKTRSFKNVIYP